MNTLVKICGIRSLDAAIGAFEAGADFVGFNFVPNSKRYISKDRAQAISKKMKGKIKRVGVFQNQPLEEINSVIDYVDLDYVQLHGDETEEFCLEINARVIKAFPLCSHFSVDKLIDNMKQYTGDLYLLDRKIQGKGEMLSLEKARKVAKEFPILFAGGLTEENVEEVVKKVRPKGVDVAGGIETEGKEDIYKIRRFVREARQTT